MDARDVLVGMAANNAWANHRLHAAVAALDDAEYRAPRTSFFPSLRETLLHIVRVDAYYLDALRGDGRGRETWAGPQHDTFPPLRDEQRQVDRALYDLVRALPDAASLERVVSIDRGDRVQKERVADVLQHLFVHQIHHRGQVHAMLAGTRVAPPQLDEYFMAEEAPLREEELRALGLPLR